MKEDNRKRFKEVLSKRIKRCNEWSKYGKEHLDYAVADVYEMQAIWLEFLLEMFESLEEEVK